MSGRNLPARAGAVVNVDPVVADINLYRYCGNRPTSLRDPSGKRPFNAADEPARKF